LEVKEIQKRRPRINQQIRIPEVRVIDPKGEQIGVMKTNEALQLAREKNLDWVEVAPGARPPVVRILDFKKYRFEKKQKKKTGQKKGKVETKELRFRPNIGSHDLQTRIDRAREFLNDGDHVKLTVQFRGREASHPELGFEKMNQTIKALADAGEIESEPKRKGRFIYATLGPK
jgi:translation initiation factor IF-3